MGRSFIFKTTSPELAPQTAQVKTWLSQEQHVDPANIQIVNPSESLKIADVRAVISASSYYPYQSGQQWLVMLAADQASQPAQNALLKILEEPPDHTSLVLVTNQPQRLLDTIQSRCELVVDPDETNQTIPETPNQHPFPALDVFTHKSYSELIELAGTFSDRSQAQQALRSWAAALHQDASHPSAATTATLQLIAETLDHLSQNANLKLALEHCLFQLKIQLKKTTPSAG